MNVYGICLGIALVVALGIITMAIISLAPYIAALLVLIAIILFIIKDEEDDEDDSDISNKPKENPPK